MSTRAGGQGDDDYPTAIGPGIIASLRTVLSMATPGLMLMRFTPMILVAVSLIVADDDPTPPRKDSQVTFEPRSTPGAGQAYLQRFAGDWQVAKTFYPRAGEPIRGEGTCRQTMIHDGRFLQSDFVFTGTGKGTTGMGIIGFEPETGVFTSFWTDSRQTAMSVRQGREKFDGNEIVLYSKSLNVETKDARRSRTVSRLEDGDKTLSHRQYAISPDGTERLMMELKMTRK